MAGKRKRPNGWEYVYKRAGVLDKPLYITYRTEEEGDAHARQIEAMLAKGITPPEAKKESKRCTIKELLTEYERNSHPSAKDKELFRAITTEKGDEWADSVSVKWVDAWVQQMKRESKIAPASIRAKVGATARAFDWAIRGDMLDLQSNPLRGLPDGYAQYTAEDVRFAGEKREDIERDRRLEAGEWERIMATVDSGVLPRKQRPLVIEHAKELKLLLVLAVESAMRLREMYTLEVRQVDLARRTVFLDKTKNGDKRQVPLSSVALGFLSKHLEKLPPNALVFPWWDGNAATLADTSGYLSKLCSSVFETAECVDLHLHDLRHEAISRLFERTTMSELEIAKVSGHRNLRMLMRYANLRGSNLAEKLW